MTAETAAQAAYIVAALLFILALAGLSKHETARLGNSFAMAGMAVALLATVALAVEQDLTVPGLGLLVVAMLLAPPRKPAQRAFGGHVAPAEGQGRRRQLQV